MEEASHGLARRILAPVRLDLVSPPLGFGEVQYADLAAWDGTDADPRFVHFRDVVRAIVNAEPVAVGPTPTNFSAPGVSMQNVSMKNVTIQVSKTMPSSQHDEAEEERAAPARERVRAERPSMSLSMMLTRAMGVIFPLIGITIFILSMGNMACDQGNAPAFFCSALNAITGRP